MSGYVFKGVLKAFFKEQTENEYQKYCHYCPR